MADANDKPRPFDVQTVDYLVRLMRENDLSEIDLSEGDQRIRLRRGTRVAVASVPSALPLAAPQSAVPASPMMPAVAADPPPRPNPRLLEIKSPTVGTFYAQKDPSSPPFISKGARVSPSTVVCVIEAMKVFNEITADCSGVVVEICVNNKDAVEFNSVLFRVDPTA